MGLFSCFYLCGKATGRESSEITCDKNVESNSEHVAESSPERSWNKIVHENHSARRFHFRELAFATENFKETNLIGLGGFGEVYKGRLGSEIVAVKQLNREGRQGCNEFVTEVLMLSTLHHENLVNLYGYCTEGDERLLIYEYMPNGSLDNHLFDLPRGKTPLDWNTRVKIAQGAARGLVYLHDTANPPVIHRDMKAANVLLDGDFNPKLSDFGLAKVGPVGSRTHVSTRVLGTPGYCAPDYARSGKLNMKSDVYSFGMLLLELITGRRAYDSSRTGAERQLLLWAGPGLKDRRKHHLLADPLLRGQFPHRALYQMVVIASYCLEENPQSRPIIAEVATALDYVASQLRVHRESTESKLMNGSSSWASSSSSSSSWNTIEYTHRRL